MEVWSEADPQTFPFNPDDINDAADQLLPSDTDAIMSDDASSLAASSHHEAGKFLFYFIFLFL